MCTFVLKAIIFKPSSHVLAAGGFPRVPMHPVAASQMSLGDSDKQGFGAQHIRSHGILNTKLLGLRQYGLHCIKAHGWHAVSMNCTVLVKILKWYCLDNKCPIIHSTICFLNIVSPSRTLHNCPHVLRVMRLWHARFIAKHQCITLGTSNTTVWQVYILTALLNTLLRAH